MSRLELHNSTSLENVRIRALCLEGMRGWAVGTIKLLVRYSRGADFSGACFYTDRRVFINLGRHLTYPYLMASNLAPAVRRGRLWSRSILHIKLQNAYEVMLFIFMHELYHLLVYRARRNRRQKEGRCDRFAARHVINRFGATVHDDQGADVDQSVWDFQNLEAFVAAARDRRVARRPIRSNTPARTEYTDDQLWLFPV